MTTTKTIILRHWIRNRKNKSQLNFFFCGKLTAARKSSKTHYSISIFFNIMNDFLFYSGEIIFLSQSIFVSFISISFICVFDSFAYDTQIHREVLLIDGTADKDTKIEKKINVHKTMVQFIIQECFKNRTIHLKAVNS